MALPGACRTCFHVCVAEPKSDGCQARGAAYIENMRKPSNDADALFGSNPKGRGDLGAFLSLLALAMLSACLRARALNCAQIATVACAKASPTGS